MQNKIHIEYLDEYLKLRDQSNGDFSYQSIVARHDFVKKYAWAIPNELAIKTIAKYAPIIEIGCGRGYWAHLLQCFGVDVIALDNRPPKKGDNYYCNDGSFIDVSYGNPNCLIKYSDYTLFLCWPPYHNNMASRCLKKYTGTHVIYIGEDQYGCTGDKTFHEKLYNEFILIEEIDIPRWPGLHDSLKIFKRK